MSRIGMNPRDPALDIIVGWDPPLQSYFCQVIRPAPPGSDAEDQILLWRGYGWAAGDEIATVPALREIVEKYCADWPDAVTKQLILDKARNA